MSHRFRVWAPAAGRVDVVVDGARHAMDRGPEGWWAATVEAAGPGSDYGFALDGEDPCADPRSRCQPDGVHGLSRLAGLDGHRWADTGWRGVELDDLAVYEVHVGTFTPEGTLDAAIARLDHVASLGMSAVELMPVAAFPGRRGWGYDGVHLWAVHEALGGPAALQRFVDACHARGLGCILDVVYNHVGPDGSVLDRYGPYFTDRYQTPWGRAVNVDGPGSDGVRAYIVENALAWLRDYHLDGLRLDAVHAIVDTSAIHILEELVAAVRDLELRTARRLLVVAESDRNDSRQVWGSAAGGYGLDAQWSDDLHHALHAALTGERTGYYEDFGALGQVAAALHRGVVYDGRHSRFRDRRHGRSHAGVPRRRLLGYLQNHDQVGNRALGERSGSLLEPAALRAAAATVLLGPFTPLLFAGEEWGARTPFQYFTDHEDAGLAAAVSAGRRREFAAFGWAEAEVPDPQDPAAFARSRLDWSEMEREPHRSLLAWHRDLLALRRGRAELRDGGACCDDAVGVDVDERARTLVMRRPGAVVAWNLGPAAARLAVGEVGEQLLAWPGPPAVEGGVAVLGPGATAVWAAGATARRSETGAWTERS